MLRVLKTERFVVEGGLVTRRHETDTDQLMHDTLHPITDVEVLRMHLAWCIIQHVPTRQERTELRAEAKRHGVPFRPRKGLTVRSIAKLAGVSDGSISGMTNKRRKGSGERQWLNYVLLFYPDLIEALKAARAWAAREVGREFMALEAGADKDLVRSLKLAKFLSLSMDVRPHVRDGIKATELVALMDTFTDDELDALLRRSKKPPLLGAPTGADVEPATAARETETDRLAERLRHGSRKHDAVPRGAIKRNARETK